MFSTQSIQQIQLLRPHEDTSIQDKLVWKHSKNGRITLKMAYQQLLATNNQPDSNHLGGKMWAVKKLQPKVKAFLWKVTHNALPTLYELKRRTKKGVSTCPRCELENETINHMMYTCRVSRVAWYMSPLGLKTDTLHLQPLQALEGIFHALSAEDFILFANTAWAVWKSRNDFIFRGKAESPTAIVAEGIALANMAINTKLESFNAVKSNPNSLAEEDPIIMDQQTEVICTVDGSWDPNGRSGIGIAFFCRRGRLQHTIAMPLQANSPFVAEVEALMNALILAPQFRQTGKLMLLTDSSNLVMYLRTQDDSYVQDWRALPTLQQCHRILNQGGQVYQVKYLKREHNDISHKLANFARLSQKHYQGFPSSQMMGQLGLSQSLPTFFFSFSQ